jgi:catechol 2,3-dioxygenase-like lactoylglutathione lyase family enzyme
MVRLMLGNPRRDRSNGAAHDAAGDGTVADLIPFLFVTDVARSIRFYEALGFELVHTFEPQGRLEFAELESTASAKVMLARVEELPGDEPQEPSRGFLYLYVCSLDALRKHLIELGFEAGEIRDGSPGPRRELCVRDPDGHGHMVAELAESSIAGDPRQMRNRPRSRVGGRRAQA